MHKHGGDIYTHKNVLDYSANINYRGMPESVKQAAKAAVEDCRNYPDPECREVRTAIALREQVEVGQVICGNGAADLIFSLVRARKPQKALLPAPTFFEYEQALQGVGCDIKRYYLKEELGFQVQEDFMEQIVEDVDILFLCNPNNPTGVLISPEILEECLIQCEKNNVFLVMDECFYDFLPEEVQYSMKHHLKDSKNIFILKAFTKMYAMAGLRFGYGLCGNDELLQQMNLNRQPWSVSIPAQMAGVAAAREEKYALESRDAIQIERRFLMEGMKRAGYGTLDSKANYIFFKGPEDLYERCLTNGILIRDCSNYEGLSKGWYRVAVKSREENLRLLEVLEMR